MANFVKFFNVAFIVIISFDFSKQPVREDGGSDGLVAKSCPTLVVPVDCSLPGSSVYADSPGKNTGVSCHFLLQGIFPTSNSGLLHCRQSPALKADSLLTEPAGKPHERRYHSYFANE